MANIIQRTGRKMDAAWKKAISDGLKASGKIKHGSANVIGKSLLVGGTKLGGALGAAKGAAQLGVVGAKRDGLKGAKVGAVAGAKLGRINGSVTGFFKGAKVATKIGIRGKTFGKGYKFKG